MSNQYQVYEKVSESGYTTVHEPQVTITKSSKYYSNGNVIKEEGGVTNLSNEINNDIEFTRSATPVTTTGNITYTNRASKYTTGPQLVSSTKYTSGPQIVGNTHVIGSTRYTTGPQLVSSTRYTSGTQIVGGSTRHYTGPQIVGGLRQSTFSTVQGTDEPTIVYSNRSRIPHSRVEHIDDTAIDSRIVSHSYARNDQGPIVKKAFSGIQQPMKAQRTVSQSSVRKLSLPVTNESRKISMPNLDVPSALDMQSRIGRSTFEANSGSTISGGGIESTEAYKKVTVNGQVMHESREMTSNGQKLVDYEYTNPVQDVAPLLTNRVLQTNNMGGREVIEKKSAKYVNGELVSNREFLKEDGQVLVDTYYNKDA